MVMAGSPQRTKSSSELTKADRQAIRIALHLADGADYLTLARKLAGTDEVAGRRWRMRIKRATKNPHAQRILVESAQAEMWLNLLPVTEAIVKRAKRGRADAVRMVWAATGFHNDKVQHEHSGEVQISLAVSRPARTEDRTKRMEIEEGIVDADVVED